MRRFLIAILWMSSHPAFAQEPVHESESGNKTNGPIELSVPEKRWLTTELYSEENGDYSALIWGHAENPRAMPEGFKVDDEIRHLAEHHIDWYSGFTPSDEKGMEKLREWFRETGMRVAMGFPTASIENDSMQLGAQPANPAMIAKGKKPWVPPIDSHYVEASLKVIEARFGKNEDLKFIRAFHLQDEPVGELPYYQIDEGTNLPIVAEWRKEVLATTGMGKWGLPKNGMDNSVPESRLAYEKFWAAKFNAYQREMAAAFRKQHPEIEVWSANFWFNQGADLLWDYDEMGKFLDAVAIDSYATQQERRSPGRGRWNAGYATKIAADLSKRPVYNHVQVLKYHDATPSVEDIYEYVSQTLRAGGKGIVYYAVDMPEYKYIRYTDPARWKAMLDIADQLRKLPKLKFPAQSPTAFWISQETLAATGPRVSDNSSYAAYVMLGETIGAPFHYVSDWAVARNGPGELKDCKIIYSGTAATWTLAGARQTLAQWIKAGGTLVLSSPDSFTREITGKRFSSWREALGVDSEPKTGARYDEWNYGKGCVLQIKQDPWVMQSWTKPEEVAFVRQLQARFGGGANEPIWRFRLPMEITSR